MNDTPKTATVPTRHLRDALSAALLVASKDRTLPVLTGCHIVCDGSDLIVEATNRFHLVRIVVPLEEADADCEPAPFDIVLEGDGLKRLHAAVPRTSKGYDRSSLSVNDAGALVASISYGETSITVQPFDGQFPRVERLIPAEDPNREGANLIGFDPAFMTALCKMPGRPRNGTVSLEITSNSKPFVSRWGGEEKGDPSYTYLLMPKRVAS